MKNNINNLYSKLKNIYDIESITKKIKLFKNVTYIFKLLNNILAQTSVIFILILFSTAIINISSFIIFFFTPLILLNLLIYFFISKIKLFDKTDTSFCFNDADNITLDRFLDKHIFDIIDKSDEKTLIEEKFKINYLISLISDKRIRESLHSFFLGKMISNNDILDLIEKNKTIDQDIKINNFN